MLALHIPVLSKSLDTKAIKMTFDLDNEILISGLLINAKCFKVTRREEEWGKGVTFNIQRKCRES